MRAVTTERKPSCLRPGGSRPGAEVVRSGVLRAPARLRVVSRLTVGRTRQGLLTRRARLMSGATRGCPGRVQLDEVGVLVEVS